MSNVAQLFGVDAQGSQVSCGLLNHGSSSWPYNSYGPINYQCCLSIVAVADCFFSTIIVGCEHTQYKDYKDEPLKLG